MGQNSWYAARKVFLSMLDQWTLNNVYADGWQGKQEQRRWSDCRDYTLTLYASIVTAFKDDLKDILWDRLCE